MITSPGMPDNVRISQTPTTWTRTVELVRGLMYSRKFTQKKTVPQSCSSIDFAFSIFLHQRDSSKLVQESSVDLWDNLNKVRGLPHNALHFPSNNNCWNLQACLRVDLLRTRIFSRSLDEVTLTITREIVPVHAKPAGFIVVRWSQGSTPRKYAAHDTYSSIFPVHKLRQTELTNDACSKWRLWPLRPAVSCTRSGADWPKVVAVGAQQPISDFLGFIP